MQHRYATDGSECGPISAVDSALDFLGSTPRWDGIILLNLVEGLIIVGHQFP